jgi:type II secretory pathway pseudopilin PulG
LSLIETIVSMSILAFIMGAIFLAFTQSSRSFRHALLRQGLQGDALKMESLFGRDVRMTNFFSVNLVSRDFTTSDGRMVRRDGLSFADLDDWVPNANFDAVTGLPLWNRYIVYYVTNDVDEGRLIRQVVDPGGPTGGLPYGALSANIRNDPSINSNVQSTTLISSQADEFEVLLDDGTHGVRVILRLKRRGERRRSGGEQKVDETLEARYSPVALNTVPKL